MEFFDRKQEVFDIQITPLGKRLLQMGQFQPTYYAFYDHDILYGSIYAGLSEQQSDIESRIQATPRLKQQVYLYSAEEKINKNTADTYGVDFATLNENLFQNPSLEGYQKLTEEYAPESLETKQYELEKFGPLGDMAYTTNYSPAWNIDFYAAPLTGSIVTLTGSFNQNIPRLRCDVQYKIRILELSDIPGFLSEMEDDPDALEEISDALIGHNYNLSEDELSSFASPITEDGSYLVTIEDQLFLKVLENNTDFLKDNVDIEIYRLFGDGEEKRLYFSAAGEDRSEDPEFVDYYFDIMADSEIPDTYYCRAVKEDKLVTAYTDKFIFDCQDSMVGDATAQQIYDIPDNEDTELCE